MLTIIEAAAAGQLLDVGERFAERIPAGPHLDFPQSRGVDDQAAARQPDQLAVAGGMSPLSAAVDFPRPQHVRAQQPVDEG